MQNEITLTPFQKLRLDVMCAIVHEEEYYKNAINSMGFNINELSHIEISILKSSLLSAEADVIIDFAINSPSTDLGPVKDALDIKIKDIFLECIER